MTIRVFIPQDTTSCALGADDVATKLQTVVSDIEIVRNSSRGAFWLEPLVEIETEAGRVAFGPVTAGDIEGLVTAGFPGDCDHALNLGPVDEIPWLKNQQRLSFVRAGVTDPLSLDDYQETGGYKGLQNALGMSAQQIVDAVKDSGLRGRGGAAFPTGIPSGSRVRPPIHVERPERRRHHCRQ